ncbi:MAG: efflux RND transporter periplasmic adaptor subunit [Candidatus Kapaibacterium sp.]|jgi:RND family efflux transporter MFP subunit
MKKVLWIAGAIAVVVVMILVLMSNKKTIEEKNANNLVQTVFPVTAIAVRDSQITTELSLVGTILANNEVNVTSETGGRITKCNIRVGQSVSAGSVLFEVDDELRLSQLRSAEAQFEKARKDSIRNSMLLREKTLPAAQWDQIELQYRMAEQQYVVARRAYNDTRIKSPISGIVSARYADVGATVNNMQSGTVVAMIVDVSSLKVRLQVAEKDVIRISEGDRVSVGSELYPGEVFPGTISAVSEKGDEAHTYTVEVRIARTAKLKPGMFARVGFSRKESRASLVIPRESIVGTLTSARVYVVMTDSKVQLRPVVLGADMNGNVEVRSGLQAGERVVVTGLNVIRDGASVRVNN